VLSFWEIIPSSLMANITRKRLKRAVI